MFVFELATQLMLKNHPIFVDEAIFGNFRLKKRVWTSKDSNLKFPLYGPQKHQGDSIISCVAGLCNEGGLIYYHI